MAYDIQVLVQSLVYLTIFVTGFVICVPLSVTVSRFDNRCILYTDFAWKNASYMSAAMSSSGLCLFPIVFALFTCIFYGLGMGLYNGYAALKTKDPTIGYQMWIMPFLLVNSLILIVSLVAACIVSVGIKSTCDSFLEGRKLGSKLSACADADQINWHSKSKNMDQKNFYAYVKVAESCSWVVLLFWIVQVCLYIVRFLRNRRYRSAGLEPTTLDPSSASAPEDLDKITSVNPTA